MAIFVHDLEVTGGVGVVVPLLVLRDRERAVDLPFAVPLVVARPVLAADADLVRILVRVVEGSVRVRVAGEPVGGKKAFVLVGVDPEFHADLEGQVGARLYDRRDDGRSRLRVIDVRLGRCPVGVRVSADTGLCVEFQVRDFDLGRSRRYDDGFVIGAGIVGADAGNRFGRVCRHLAILLLVANEAQPAQGGFLIARGIFGKAEIVLRRQPQFRRTDRLQQGLASPVVLPRPVVGDAGVVVEERYRQPRLARLLIPQDGRPVEFIPIQPVAFLEQLERCQGIGRDCRQQPEAQHGNACRARAYTRSSTVCLQRNTTAPDR